MGEFDALGGVTIRHARAPHARGFRIDANYTPDGARTDLLAFLERIQHPRYCDSLNERAGNIRPTSITCGRLSITIWTPS